MPTDKSRETATGEHAIQVSHRSAAQENQRLGWCPCGSEPNYECECGLSRLSFAQGKLAPNVVRLVRVDAR